MGIEALVVLLLIVSPGFLADSLYRFLLWRPDPSEQIRISRGIALSGAGLVLALLAASIAPSVFPEFPYLVTSWWKNRWQGDYRSVGTLIVPFLSHVGFCIAVSGIGVALMKRDFVAKGIRRLTGQSLHRNAWDEFAAANFKQWVFVCLTDGREYFGELGVVSGDHTKDLVLWHPHPYRSLDQTYEIQGVRALFVPASQIASVKVPATGPELDVLQQYIGRYTLSGAKVDDGRQKEVEQRREVEQQQHALGAEGKPNERA